MRVYYMTRSLTHSSRSLALDMPITSLQPQNRKTPQQMTEDNLDFQSKFIRLLSTLLILVLIGCVGVLALHTTIWLITKLWNG